MPRLFKDLVVNESDHAPRVNLINRDGSVALHEVSVELASTAAQQGDRWGAKEANLLLKIGDDGVPYPDIEGYYTEAEVNALLVGKAAASHTQAAGSITAGTLATGVLAANSTDYGTSRLRNAYFATTMPGSLTNGMVCFVYE